MLKSGTHFYMSQRILRIGTRNSPLALIQARQAIEAMQQMAVRAIRVRMIPIKTTGDKLLKHSLADKGGKGLFTRELESALLAEHIDVAVHSAKDLPAHLPTGLKLWAYLKREDPRDALISKDFDRTRDLPPGARVGTSSPRRQAQLLALRPDLKIVPFRGNVGTRLKKIERGEAEATLLACAGLKRLKKNSVIRERLSTSLILPAPGQGAIALEARINDYSTGQLLTDIDHRLTHLCVAAERALVAELGASCATPLGGLARINKNMMVIRAALFSTDGQLCVRASVHGPKSKAEILGRRVAIALIKKAPRGLLKSIGLK